MMLYTVFFTETYGDYSLLGVYSSKEKAEQGIEKSMVLFHGSDYEGKTWEREYDFLGYERVEHEYLIIENELDKDAEILLQ